jgi:hypothetical protein
LNLNCIKSDKNIIFILKFLHLFIVKTCEQKVTLDYKSVFYLDFLSAINVNTLNAELNPICHLLVLLGDLTFMGPYIVSIFQYIDPTRCNVTQFIYIWKLLYVFRVVFPPIIRSAYNCIYSIWYLSHRYCYLHLVGYIYWNTIRSSPYSPH